MRMVTELQFYNAVRSYSYRTKLLEGLNELEQRIMDYLNDRNLTRKALPGYFVEVYEDGLKVKELPRIDLNQLYLGFYAKSKNDGDGKK